MEVAMIRFISKVKAGFLILLGCFKHLDWFFYIVW